MSSVASLGAKPFPGLSPRQGRQNSTCSSLTLLFRKFRSFSASGPDLSLLVTFSKTHRRTQRIHSWIDLDMAQAKKLVRSETNSQILRNLHFCDPFTPIFDQHVETQFPSPLYYSQSQKGSTSHFSAYEIPSGEKISAGNAQPETRPRSFCSSFNGLSGMAGPLPNERLDFEKSSLEHARGDQLAARGKPSTFVYRAG